MARGKKSSTAGNPSVTPLAVPGSARATAPLRELLRFHPGTPLNSLDPAGTPGFPGRGKNDAAEITAVVGPVLSEWQERLFAEGRSEADAPRLLVVLQGLDTSGKGGVVRHVFGLVDPQGLHLASFKQPTPIEQSHHYLWRIRKALPGPGMIGVFDRSHYEDVLVVRVNQLVPAGIWQQRYDEINRFEAKLKDQGTTIIKCFLHIDKKEQGERLLARVHDPTKYWKYSVNDVAVRHQWQAYAEAYQEALDRCSTDHAPWFVIPSNRKWYRNWAVANLLLEHLEAMDPQWPPAHFDIDQEIERIRTA
ncbi:MAG: polyphosphate kinase 2 family protein [Propionibacteriaceae bacterium]|jgi:PPK2 family polyphosphate:nucleotide phosphotransferase|nr:polyphosphate kinase 2 family protein [Propionibacteriaceae bacterium]